MYILLHGLGGPVLVDGESERK